MLDWSTTYRFEELPIVVQGKLVGSFSGDAELAEDHGGEFYVDHICLDGGVVLDKHGISTMGFPSEFEAELFRLLEAQILKSPDAQHHWNEEYGAMRVSDWRSDRQHQFEREQA